MSDLIVSTVFVFAVYSAWACAIYQPRPASTAPVTPSTVAETTAPEITVTEKIQELEPEAPAIKAQPAVVIFQARPVAAFSRIAAPVAPSTEKPDLAKLTCKQLHTLAKSAKIPYYKKLNKAELIKKLS